MKRSLSRQPWSLSRTASGLTGAVAATTLAFALFAWASTVFAQSQPERGSATEGASSLPFPLTVPTGFQISLVSNQVPGARFLAVAPNGDVIVSLIRRGRVVAIHPGAPVDAPPALVADGLDLPNGLVFHGDDLYIGTWTGAAVVRDYSRTTSGATTMLFDDMPRNRGHNARAIAVAADGSVFISSGSDCNVCTESDPRLATILRYNPDGSDGEIFATGLRNASGLAFDTAGRLWAVVNQRDNLIPDHTDLPPDELDLIVEGGNYGWPNCYPIGRRRVANPEYPGADCSRALPTAIGFQAHSAPLGMTFYTGNQFPPSYRGSLFVAFHGSWNRTPPTGYKVVSVTFGNGRPIEVRNFVTGWLTSSYQVRGRPVGVAVGTDGSLFISDDRGYIFKVTYRE